MTWYLLLFIYCARIMDVSCGTVRTICMVRGFRKTAVLLGFFEVELDFIIVPRRLVSGLMDAIFKYAPRAMVTVEDLHNAQTEELRLLRNEESAWDKLLKFK